MGLLGKIRDFLWASWKVTGARILLTPLNERTPPENLLLAIDMADKSLLVLNPQEHFPLWEQAHRLSGLSHLTLARRGQTANLDPAREHFGILLGWYERLAQAGKRLETPDKETPRTLVELGTVYLQLYAEETKANFTPELNSFHKACDAFNQALTYCHGHNGPAQEGKLRLQIAYALYQHYVNHNQHHEALEQAIKHSKRALRVLSQQSNPEPWGLTHFLLILLYLERGKGNPRENQERAALHLERAGRIESLNADPDLSPIMAEIAVRLQAGRLSGRRMVNIDEAQTLAQDFLSDTVAAAYTTEASQALKMTLNLPIFDFGSDPMALNGEEEYREVITRMETAVEGFSELARSSSDPKLPSMLAIAHVTLSLLRFYSKGISLMADLPLAEKFTHAEVLSSYEPAALAALVRVNNPAVLEDLEQAFARGLPVLEKYVQHDADPIEAGVFKVEISRFLHLRSSIFPEKFNDAATRLKYLSMFEEGFAVLTEQLRDPHMCYLTGRAYGMLYYFSDRQWAEAEKCFRVALSAQEELFNESIGELARRNILLGTNSLRHHLPLCLSYAVARQGPDRLREAVEVLEKWRVRQMSEELQMQEFYLAEVSDEDRQQFSRTSQRIADLRTLQREQHDADYLELLDELEAALAERDLLIEKARASHPALMRDFTFENIRRAASDTEPLAYLFMTEMGGAIFLVTATGEPEVIWCDDVAHGKFLSLIYALAMSQPALVKSMIPDDEETIEDPGEYLTTKEFLARLKTELGGSLIEPLRRRLREMGASAVSLIPCGVLPTLPLHAITDDEGQCLLDQFTVRYAHNAKLLAARKTTLHRTRCGPDKFLGIGNPSGDLPAARAEVVNIAGLFPQGQATVLLGPQATLKELKRVIAGTTHLHLACHGKFHGASPLDSVFTLARNEPLTLRLILSDPDFRQLSRVRLVVLSACQSALIEFLELPEEAVGFPAALLQTGVSGVVGTLWPVVDASTALLIAKFYALMMSQSQEPAEALCAAQRWLRGLTKSEVELFRTAFASLPSRDATYTGKGAPVRNAFTPEDVTHPYADPYYWAGFVFVGV